MCERERERRRDNRPRTLTHFAHLLHPLRVDFTNILHAHIPKAQKDTDDLTVFFLALLGSARVKASHKMLAKMTLNRHPPTHAHPRKRRRRKRSLSDTKHSLVAPHRWRLWRGAIALHRGTMAGSLEHVPGLTLPRQVVGMVLDVETGPLLLNRTLSPS